MGYKNLLKQIDAEIERLEKVRQLLSEPASAKKSTTKKIARPAQKKAAQYRDVAGSVFSPRAKKNRTVRYIVTKRSGVKGGSGGSGTENDGYSVR